MKIKIDSIHPLHIDISTSEGKDFLLGGIDVHYTAYSGSSAVTGEIRIERDGQISYLNWLKALEEIIVTDIKQKFK